MTDKETYYPYFDYLRIILATVVMLYHDKLLVWEHAGSLAVDVFFALSGWLIGGVLLKTEKADLPRFFFNRAVRIWLPYYFACALLIAASLLKDPLDGKWFELIFYKLTFVYNLFGTSQLADPAVSFPLDGTGNHFWSINAEEQFYLLAPLLLVLLPYLGRSKWLWGLIVAVAWVLEIYAPITFGVLAVVLVNRYGHFYSHIWCRIVLAVIAIATAVGMAINDSNYAWYAPVFSICIVLLLAVKGKKRPFGELLGGMSYPLYLNHWVGSFVMNALQFWHFYTVVCFTGMESENYYQ